MGSKSDAQDSFQPIAVQSPANNIFLFYLRCLVDIQTKTIASFLKREFAKLPPGPIVDIGAGQSPWKCWLPSHCQYRGIDIKNADDFGMDHRSKDIVYYDGGKMPLDSNFFDGALCIEVLEHAENPDLLVSEVYRILKPGAPLLLSIPWSARRHHIPFDFQRFTREGLQRILSRNGFADITIEERGNDYCVVFNKITVIIIRNLKSLNPKNFFLKLSLVLILSPFALVFFILAHFSLMVATSDGIEDPLGYFCIAKKSIFIPDGQRKNPS